MKKSTRIFVTFVIALFSTLILFGKNTNNKYPEKIQFKPEKEIKIITVAQKVAQEIAPQFRTDTLVAVIYTAPYSMKKDVVDVHFMKHEDDHIEYHKGKRDTVNKRLIIDSAPIKRPNSILTVTIYESTLDPESISDSYSRSISFEPNYIDFRKNNPNKKLEPYINPTGENVIF